MIRSFFTGVTGLRSNQIAVDTISNNIANVNTNGFKSSTAFFQDLFSQKIGESNDLAFQAQVGLGTKIGAVQVNFSNGALQFTGRDLDMALEGDGYFVVGDVNADYGTNTVDGVPGIDTTVSDITVTSLNDRSELMYTRDGTFEWSDAGFLVTVEGHYVMQYDAANPNTLTRISNATSTDLPAEIAVSKVDNNNGLEKIGGNLWIETTKSGTPTYANSNDIGYARVRSQVVEMSNVDLGLEFSRLIIASRAYQANSRSITTSDEMLQELMNIKR
jgi:flagellar hook protein FlgE